MFEFIGHFHPLLVHLPIGILLLAILFEWLPARKKFRALKKSIDSILLIGSLTAIASCITGYLLSQNGEYESGMVDWHQWMGITLTIYSFAFLGIRSGNELKSIHKTLSVILLILITITGHLGGSLTHGEDYLTSGLFAGADLDLSTVNLKEAKFYDDLVKPILEDKCTGCHGPGKQKAKLRLDEPAHILKGSKNGVVLVAGKTDESELIDRLLLPLGDEDHMPPKEKKQPSEKEIEILKIWIATGADFKKSVTEAGQLAVLEKLIASKKAEHLSDIPADEVPAADPATLSQLARLDVSIFPVVTGSNYLSANLINATSIDSAIDLLIRVKEQLIWLKAGDQPVTDTHVYKLLQLDKLSRLSLNNTQITDGGLIKLNPLKKLQYLNLNGNAISAAGLSQLKGLAELKSCYVYQTHILPADIEPLRKVFPSTTIEGGNYLVPILSSDTIEAKASVVK